YEHHHIRLIIFFFFSSRRRHTRWPRDWSSDVCSSDLAGKHVFCEKPFALTKADAEQAVDATRKAGVALGLGYNRRFHPEMTKLRSEERRVGKECRSRMATYH